MSWLADILKPQQKHVTLMAIELAPTDHITGPAPAQTTNPEPAAVVIEPMHPRLNTADALSAEELERHLVALSQPRLQGLAQRVAAARSRLLDLTAAAEAMSMAMDAAHYMGCDPEHWLQTDLAEVQAQIAQAEAGRKRAEARRVARSARVTPLFAAVGKFHTELVAERNLLRERVYLLKKNGIGLLVNHELSRAGLTTDQIATLGPVGQGDRDLTKYEARLSENEPKISAIEAWQASERRDHQHLDGLGFDTLVEGARPLDESEAPA